MSSWAAVVGSVSLVCAGCGLLLEPPPGQTAVDGGPAERVDAAGSDVGVDAGSDAGSDAGTNPPWLPVTEPAGLPPAPGCADRLDEHTLALYRMEDLVSGALTDDRGVHDGFFRNASPTDTDGPTDHTGVSCGRALQAGAPLFGVIDDSPDWQLTIGSVDFWVRAPAEQPSESWGILSRDASGQDLPGHFTVYFGNEGGVGIRIQGDDATGVLYLLSDGPIPVDEWVHVGVNFGPPGPSLYVDGAAQASTDALRVDAAPDDICQADCWLGIDGNLNPWVVGARATRSDEGAYEPASHEFRGAIDEIRISNSRRDFTSITP